MGLPENVELPGDRRVDNLGREAFHLAVTMATKAATQEVGRIHRVRLVTQAALASFVVAVSIALISAVVLYGAAVQNARRDSRANCGLIVRLIDPLADFVASDAALRAKQAQLTPRIQAKFAKLLGKSTLLRAQAKAATLNASTVNYWEHSVVPRLRAVGSTDCR